MKRKTSCFITEKKYYFTKILWRTRRSVGIGRNKFVNYEIVVFQIKIFNRPI